MIQVDQIKRYLISETVLLFLTVVAVVSVALLTFRHVRWANGEERRWATYLKFTLLLYAVFVILDFVIYALRTFLLLDDGINATMRKAEPHIVSISHFIRYTVDIIIMLVFVHLAVELCVIYAGRPRSSNRSLKLASYGVAVLFLILSATSFALLENVNTIANINLLKTPIDALDQLESSRKLDLSLTVLFFVLSLCATVSAAVGRFQARKISHAQTATTLFLACMVLLLLRWTFELAIQIILTDAIRNAKNSGEYINLLEIILTIWPEVVILWIFFLQAKKPDGVWSSKLQPTSTPDSVDNGQPGEMDGRDLLHQTTELPGSGQQYLAVELPGSGQRSLRAELSGSDQKSYQAQWLQQYQQQQQQQQQQPSSASQQPYVLAELE